jgi:PAS domain S-box-containing protein
VREGTRHDDRQGEHDGALNDPTTPSKEGECRDRAPGRPPAPKEQRFQLLVNSVRDYAIFMLDPEGYVVSWNLGAERLKGYRADEIIGRHFSTFYTEDARRARHPDDELRQAKADGRYEEEGWRVRKDGSEFWASVVITALTDEKGCHIGFAKVTRDVTERRRVTELLRQSEERLRLLVESVKDYAIFMLDADGMITTWNTGAQHIKGYLPHEVIGKHYSIFYPPDDIARGRPERELRIASTEGRYEEEGWRIRKGGERFWANVVITAVKDPVTGELRGFAKVTRDLTEKRRMELEARRAAEDAAVERSRASEATAALKLRDEFISVASHELRTPLTALQLKVQGVTLALSSDIADSESSQLKKYARRLDGALRQIERMSGLVERLLDVSRIGQHKLILSREETDLAALTRQVLEDFRETALQAGSELRVHADAPVVGAWDRARMEQVVANLLSNATTYGAGQPIDVTVEASDTGARLTISDRGIGIAPEDLDRIFARFERAAPIRNYSGLGVGLYIARSIVEAHGGAVRASSILGQGATFVVELPRQVEPVEHPSASPVESPA